MIGIRNVSHQFRIGKRGKERVVPVLHEIDLEVRTGEIVAIVGRSGSGKSTLLNLMSGYIRPSSGQIHLMGQNVTGLSEGEWADFRLAHLGFMFQSFQLIPGMTAFENAELPLVFKGTGIAERRARVMELLEQLGIAEYAGHYPGELSGGQQQRVSVARALALSPPIVLADEPTGSLDSANERQLLAILKHLNQDRGTTLVLITHDDQVASIAHRTIALDDGRLSCTPGKGEAAVYETP